MTVAVSEARSDGGGSDGGVTVVALKQQTDDAYTRRDVRRCGLVDDVAVTCGDKTVTTGDQTVTKWLRKVVTRGAVAVILWMT